MGIEPKIDQQPEQPGDVPITFADVSKSKKMLDYDPKLSIDEGVGQFVEWFKRNKDNSYSPQDLEPRIRRG